MFFEGGDSMAEISEMVTLAQAGEILAARGVPLDPAWLRAKTAAGKIEGAVKIGKTWLIPRSWAETYEKIKSGRPRKAQ